ncbi:MAG: hypothetical protein ABEH77_08250, partial [Halobacteriaceae archaeon]
FENDEHERRVADVLREEGLDVSYSLSSDVLPEIREYERTLTTSLNAALKPVMESYIGELEGRVRDEGVPHRNVDRHTWPFAAGGQRGSPGRTLAGRKPRTGVPLETEDSQNSS